MSQPQTLPKNRTALEAVAKATAEQNALVIVVLADFDSDQNGVDEGSLAGTVSIIAAAGDCLPANVLDAVIRDVMPRLGRQLGSLVNTARAAETVGGAA